MSKIVFNDENRDASLGNVKDFLLIIYWIG